MADDNEEVVRSYFELKGYLVKTNILYEDRSSARGMGWSDVDLCVLHPRTGDCAAVEVKGWHTERISPSYLKEWPQLFHFTRPEALAAVEGVLGRSDFRRILVVGQLGPQKADEVIAYAQERGVEILQFPEILQELIDLVPLGRSAANHSEHMVRVLKAYGFLTD